MEVTNSGKQDLFNFLEYEPHDGQVKAHNLIDHYDVVTLVCGRRFGKSHMAVYEAAYQAMQKGDAAGPPVVYIVSDTYKHSQKIFNPLVTLFETDPALKKLNEKIYRKDQTIILKNGAEIWAKSADTPNSLAGDSVSFAIIDEAGFVTDYAMDILRPAFAARENPKRLNIGTPDRSDTFFKTEFDLGLQDLEGYMSLQLPSAVNPLVSAAYLERERRLHSEEYYRRMYLAEFIDLDETPFAKLLKGMKVEESPLPPINKHKYVAGVDLADRTDYTAVTIVDVTERPYRLVYVERWNGIGYEATGLKIANILKEYNNAYAYADRTGVGDAAIPHITKHYGNVQPVVFTQAEKQSMFDTIYTSLEKRELKLYNDSTLLTELRNLRAIQKSRGISYQAPAGMHDDIAMSLFLAGKGFKRTFTLPKSFDIGGFRTAL